MSAGDTGGAGARWKYRPPPRGVTRDSLQLCSVTRAGDTCHVGELCDEAHSPEELEEWRERWAERHRSGWDMGDSGIRTNPDIHAYHRQSALRNTETYSQKILLEKVPF